MQGLHDAVKLMSLGEKATFEVPPLLGFGKKGIGLGSSYIPVCICICVYVRVLACIRACVLVNSI